MIHGFAQFLTLFALDTARHTAAAWVVGHQDQIAACQRNKGGEGCALVATLFFFDLNDQFLAFAQGVLNARGAHIDTFFKVTASDFFERQKAVTFFAVAHEAGFEAGFNTGDDAFIDVAFTLFTAGDFNVKVDELLPVDDGNPKFFRVCCIK